VCYTAHRRAFGRGGRSGPVAGDLVAGPPQLETLARSSRPTATRAAIGWTSPTYVPIFEASAGGRRQFRMLASSSQCRYAIRIFEDSALGGGTARAQLEITSSGALCVTQRSADDARAWVRTSSRLDHRRHLRVPDDRRYHASMGRFEAFFAVALARGRGCASTARSSIPAATRTEWRGPSAKNSERSRLRDGRGGAKARGGKPGDPTGDPCRDPRGQVDAAAAAC